MANLSDMFPAEVYALRREALKSAVGSGLILLPGNDESPINCRGITYPFRQDSTFLYYFGLDLPGLDALIDIDNGREVLFGADPGPVEMIWSGAQPSLAELARRVGVEQTASPELLAADCAKAAADGRQLHILTPYRGDHSLKLERLLGLDPGQVEAAVSTALIQAVVAQRSVKGQEEVEQIEKALAVTRLMHLKAMDMIRPGVHEYEVVAAMQAVAYAQGGLWPAYTPIFSVQGHILHNPHHVNRMEAGQMAINDTAAESPMRYASDITRTLPVSGRFTTRQKEIHDLVLQAQQAAIAAIRPGVAFRDIHLLAAGCLAQGLRDLGLLRGEVEELVSDGVHALFFPHGLGHMLGLDTHDMESLGEDRVGYDSGIHRSGQFGLNALRLARTLQPGFVVTVEPGLYFIPALIDQWRAEKRFISQINYPALEAYRHFGGVRIEDNVLVTSEGGRILGPPIPATLP